MSRGHLSAIALCAGGSFAPPPVPSPEPSRPGRGAGKWRIHAIPRLLDAYYPKTRENEPAGRILSHTLSCPICPPGDRPVAQPSPPAGSGSLPPPRPSNPNHPPPATLSRPPALSPPKAQSPKPRAQSQEPIPSPLVAQASPPAGSGGVPPPRASNPNRPPVTVQITLYRPTIITYSLFHEGQRHSAA